MIKRIAPYILIFVVALLLRMYGLNDAAIFPDEITWMVRGKETFLAFRTFDIQHILYYLDGAWWNIKDDTQAIALPLVGFVGPFIAYLGKGGGILSYNLFEDQVISRAVVVTLNSLFFLLFYYFAKKITHRSVALFATLIFLLDPTVIGFSRIVINDSLLMIFSFLAIVSYVYTKNKRRLVMFSSLWLTASFLTKPMGVLPSVVWLSYASLSKDKKQHVKILLVIGVLSTALISIIWSPSWSDPIVSVIEYGIRQIQLVQVGNKYFFFGEITNNPAKYYYLFQLTTKLPVYVLLASLGYVLVAMRRFYKSNNRSHFILSHKFEISVLIYFIAFLLIISFSPKKLGIRYALPLFPWIYLASSWFVYELLSGLKNNKLRFAILSVLVFISLFTSLRMHPYYEFYSNSLIGGPKGAQKYDLVGLCYGARESVEYINECYPDVQSIAYLGCSKTVIPYYSGLSVSTNWQAESIVVIEESEAVLNSEKVPFVEFGSKPSDHEIVVNGLILSKIYVQNNNLESNCN